MPSGPSLLNDSESVQILPGLGAQLDRHVHRDAEIGVQRSLDGVGDRDALAGLVLEQVDRVRGVVPEQVVGPRARLAEGVHVGTPEEVRLHVHLLDRELARRDAPVHPLVRRVEPSRVADHGDEAGLPGHPLDLERVRPGVGQRDLHLHVLPGAQRGDRLLCVQLRGGAEDDGVDVVAGERVVEIGRRVRGAVLRSHLLRLLEPTADDRRDGDAVDRGEGVEVLDAEGSGSGEGDAHDVLSVAGGQVTGSRTRCPTAVLLAGTW